jgi:HEAT repeat protein
MGAACSRKAKPIAQKSTEDLLADLADQRDDGTRAAALRQLGLNPGRTTVAILIVTLNDTSVRVRSTAVEVLAKLKDPQAADALLRMVQDPTQGLTLRMAAARALAAMGDVRSVDYILQAQVAPRSDAMAALVSLGPAAVPPLIEGLRTSTTRDAASRALARIGNPAVGPLIEVLHTNETKYTKLAVYGVLAEINDPRAVGALTEALRTSNGDVESAAYRFLIRRGQPGTETKLLDALRTFGRRQMAEDFIWSGNSVLKAAGESWSRDNNFEVEAQSKDIAEAHWGEWPNR